MSPTLRHPFLDQDVDDLVNFALAHPGGNHDEALIRTMLTTVPASPAHVLDLRTSSERVLVAVLLDTLTNATGTAVLDVLGLNQAHRTPALFATLLDWAEQLTRQGPRQAIEVPLPTPLAMMQETLQAQGYQHGYSCYDMATTKLEALPTPPAPLPEPWHWQDFSEPYMRPYYELLVAAFAEIPGTQITSWDKFPAMTRRAPIAPRLLLRGEQLAGTAKVALQGDDQAEGYIATIARHPDCRDARLGPHLLHEAMRMLHERGANRYSLCVAASNQRALALYQSQGFAVTGEEPSYIKALTGNGRP